MSKKIVNEIEEMQIEIDRLWREIGRLIGPQLLKSIIFTSGGEPVNLKKLREKNKR